MIRRLMLLSLLLVGCSGEPTGVPSATVGTETAALTSGTGESWVVDYTEMLGWRAISPSVASSDTTMASRYIIYCSVPAVDFIFSPDSLSSRLVGSESVLTGHTSFMSVLPVTWAETSEENPLAIAVTQYEGWPDWAFRIAGQWQLFMSALVIKGQGFQMELPFEAGSRTFHYPADREAILQALIRCTGLDTGGTDDPEMLVEKAYSDAMRNTTAATRRSPGGLDPK